jgi:chromosome segregation ATPase
MAQHQKQQQQATQEMSYAQALNEAKQVIIQQSSRIKGDLEKIKGQQQTIVDQAARVTETEARIMELSSDFARQAEELRTVEGRYTEAEAGRKQAEGVINRQGERINHLEAQVEQLTKDLESANEMIADLSRERDELRVQLPTNDDIEALNSMMALLSQKRSSGSSSSSSSSPFASDSKPSMRIVAEAA